MGVGMGVGVGGDGLGEPDAAANLKMTCQIAMYTAYANKPKINTLFIYYTVTLLSEMLST